jgi:tetraacyldisaccharide 4'-kinase
LIEQDYDRDPEALRSLAVKVWVLSSSLQIMPLKEDGEDELMRKVKEIIAATRHKKVTCVVDSSIRGTF